MQHYWRGTGAGKPLTALTHAAGSRQRERGELPQQPSGALRGIAASPQAGAAQTEHQSCAGHSLAQVTLSSRPLLVCFPRPWQLLLCSSCTARGTHRRCSFLSQGTASWECNACAGEGTGKRQTAACCWAGARRGLAPLPLAHEGWEPRSPIPLTFPSPLAASGSSVDRAGPSTASQQGLPPLIGPITLESSSTSSTTSQAPSGPAHVPKVPESGVPRNQHRIKWRRICTRLHRIDDEWNEPQECCGSSRAAALLSVESSTPNSASQQALRSTRHSPAAGSSHRRRQGQQDHTRSRSPLQRQAAGSPSQPQRHRGSRQAPARSAERRTNRRRQRRAPRSSRVSAAAAGSRSRQPGRARTRSRSPRQHRDADTRSQPHRRRRSRSRRRGPAQGRSRSRVPRRARNINSRPR